MFRVLVVDDNRSSADALSRVLTKRGYQVDTAYDGAAAIRQIDREPPDLVFTDLKMEPVDGMAVLRHARSRVPAVDVIVFTAYGEVDLAVEAMQLGALDFLTKPVTIDQIGSRLQSLASGETNQHEDNPEFIAESSSAQGLLERIRSITDVPSPVWIEGEVGVGRSYAAWTIHKLNDPTQPYLVMDPTREFIWPQNGTVLIPSIDSYNLDVQRYLCRALPQAPEGVRFMATAAPESRRRVADGSLLAELYYSLAVVTLEVPPLRFRRDDIIPMFKDSLAAFCVRYSRPLPQLSSQELDAMLNHGWPGNVRELRNLAERTAVLGKGGFNLQVLAPTNTGMPQLEPGFSLSQYLESVEKNLLQEALRLSNGDRNRAGGLLGVERNTLRYKLNKYGLLDK